MQWNEYRNRILAEIDSRAFFYNELENIESRGEEAKASCPFAKERHESGHDVNPSMSVNFIKGTYYCPVCGSKGNVHTYLKDKYGLSSDAAWFKLGDGLGIERPEGSAPLRPDIDTELPSYYHRKLMELTGPIRKVLRERRGFTDKTLRDKTIGWDGERVTIPIYDEYNRLINIRRYKWDAPEGNQKVLNYVDAFGNTYGDLAIYGIENLVDDNIRDIIWCEGETDRILSEQYGFPTCCPTSGAGSWNPSWLRYFRNKRRVYICQDNDAAGEEATAKIADRLSSTVEVRIIKWPADFIKKGDITDFYVGCKMNAADFKQLMDSAELYEGKGTTCVIRDESNTIGVHLADSSNAELFGRRIKVPVLVSGKDTAPFICPKEVIINCGDRCDMDSPKCKLCKLAQYNGDYKLTILPTDPNIMKLIKCTESTQQVVIKKLMGVNMNCKVVNVMVDSYMNVEEVRLIPKAEQDQIISKDKEYVVRMGYVVDTKIVANKRYTLYGNMYPEPSTQISYYVFDKAVPDKDLASDFELTPDMIEQLKKFRPAEGQSVTDKIFEIHEDFEHNVTKVWERKDVAVAVDLVYSSVLSFYFQGSYVKRGWVELCIIGDSGQAKSTLVERMLQHYRLGDMISGESSKRTGLLYNLQQTNKRWMLQWGALPLNDGGLLVIDELSGLSEDDIALMSDVRTSGIAKVTGVITSETNSRTRVIYISNPRNGKQLNTETYGVESILRLWGKTEDVRRLDLALAVASGDVSADLINRDLSEMKAVPHTYTSDMCNARTLWIWSRNPDQIEITPEALKVILESAIAMGNKYSSKIPLVESADQRLKLARLSISVAGMLFSTNEDYTKIVVKPEHVKFVVNFLNSIYSKKSFAYDKYSETDKKNSDCSSAVIARLRKEFLLLPLGNNQEQVASSLLDLSYLDRFALADYTGLIAQDLQQLMMFLTTNKLVERCKNGYRRTPVGTALFEDMKVHPLTYEELRDAKNKLYSKTEY